MKKLKLKLDSMKEMLSKEQMRKINGGYYQTLECDTEICDENADVCGAGCSCVVIYDAIHHGVNMCWPG